MKRLIDWIADGICMAAALVMIGVLCVVLLVRPDLEEEWFGDDWYG